MTHQTTDPAALRLAAAVPTPEDDGLPPPLNERDAALHLLCERWVYWCRTRRLYGPAPISGTILGKLSGSSSRPLKVTDDVICSAELSAFHIAYTCQPAESLDRQVFDAYYVHRVKPIKRAADVLGISRKHFYTLLTAFRVRVANAADAIQADNQTAHQAMVARRAERETSGTIV